MVMRKAKGIEEDFCAYGVPTEHLPDPVVRTMDALRGQICALMDRVEALEKEREAATGATSDGAFAGRGQKLPLVVGDNARGRTAADRGESGSSPIGYAEVVSVSGSNVTSPSGDRDEEERRAASCGQA